MSEFKARTPQIVDLAERLIADIEARNLQPGDRYLTTAAAARMLGVGNTPANRALQLLEHRRVIVRQQRLGAFVAALPRDRPLPPLQRVYILGPQDCVATEGLVSDSLLMGMQQELPGVSVQVQILPADDAQTHVHLLVEETLSGASQDGVVLVRAPYEVQEMIARLGAACVVYGGVYPGLSGLCRLDRDMAGVGRLAADGLLERGHSRIAVLSHQLVWPGDQDTLDAIRERLASRELLADAVVERFLPASQGACEAEVGRLLDTPNPPTGFFCRTELLADAVLAEVGKRNLRSHDEVDIVLCDDRLTVESRCRFVAVRPRYSLEELGRRLARMLAERARGEECRSEMIPVVIDNSAQWR